MNDTAFSHVANSCYTFCKQWWLLILTLLGLVVLRMPNFFDPYWYGDEAIYLTIGNALRQGRLLYAEIIDHKTPLIYYLAMVPSQNWFRLLNLIWMLAATTLFWSLLRRLVSIRWVRALGLTAFVLLTTLPWFEGHIPNGELFVMGFVLAGVWILLQTRTFSSIVEGTPLPSMGAQLRPQESIPLLLSGILFGLGILTKIPGLLDLVGVLAVLWMSLVRQTAITKTLFQRDAIWQLLGRHITAGSVPFFGATVAIGSSILYYLLRGTLDTYLQFGLLYNFQYAGSWGLPFSNEVLLFLFTLQGKLLILTLFIFLISACYKWVRPALQLSLAWVGFALVASTLSNRPYPHYFLQVFPPLLLSLSLVIDGIVDDISHASLDTTSKLLAITIPTTLTAVPVACFIAILVLLDVGLYDTSQYYSQFTQFATGQRSGEAYRNSFNYLMNDNYAAAETISSVDPDTIFIWGTNPMLYAMTDTAPSGRFTVAFHIHDLQLYAETLEAVRADMPAFIVVMNGEDMLEGLPHLLEAAYSLNMEYDNFTLWKRRDIQTTMVQYER